ncbi:hypothetical protein [Roseovarius mucosus]|uniref:calcium-binding protein n=1 Tax=Roseovarius mucosus TaxID=215743 RepID=UPI003F6E9F9F
MTTYFIVLRELGINESDDLSGANIALPDSFDATVDALIDGFGAVPFRVAAETLPTVLAARNGIDGVLVPEELLLGVDPIDFSQLSVATFRVDDGFFSGDGAFVLIPSELPVPPNTETGEPNTNEETPIDSEGGTSTRIYLLSRDGALSDTSAIAGLKIAVEADVDDSVMTRLSNLGAIPIRIAVAEHYQALQTGVVDAVVLTESRLLGDIGTSLLADFDLDVYLVDDSFFTGILAGSVATTELPGNGGPDTGGPDEPNSPPPDRFLEGSGGNDTLRGGEGNDTIAGGDGDDSIEAGGGNDNISASDGNDFVDAGAGNDSVGGGLGNDTIFGTTGDDVMGAGFGDDVVSGGVGNDVVAGGAGNDTLEGGDGNDSMSGSFGNDLISGGDGADDIGGGTGRDTIDAGAGNDRVGGGEGDDSIQGGAGNDFLAGGGRNDTIDGGSGADTINGGAGNDRMTGGAGADQFVFSAFNEGETDVITDFQDGIDRLFIRIINPDTGETNITNGNAGLSGFVAALGILDTAAGAQLNVNGHRVLIEGVAAADLTVDDFQFL